MFSLCSFALLAASIKLNGSCGGEVGCGGFILEKPKKAAEVGHEVQLLGDLRDGIIERLVPS